MRYRWIPFVLLLGACSSPFSQGRQSTVGWKQVLEKREPVYLIAVDLSECTVTKERYAKINPGDNVFCNWRATRTQ
jgi:hypothetical protein